MPIPAGDGVFADPPSGPLYYDPQLSRVRLTATDLLDSELVTVQRSTDLIRWATIRGGLLNPAGGVVRLDDYEFAPDVTNYYRLMGPAFWDTFSRVVSGSWGGTWVTSGGTGANYGAVGGLAQHLHTSVNTLLTSLADIGTTDGTLHVDVRVPVLPTGAPITVWVPVRAVDLGTYYAAVLTFATSGAVSIALAKRVGGTLTYLTALVPIGTNDPLYRWQIRVDWHGTALKALAYQGNFVPDWQVSAVDADVTSGTKVGALSRLETSNTNGATTIAWSLYVVASPQVTLFSGSVVPVLPRAWLKSIARPFLNRSVTVLDYSDVERPSRAGLFDVPGRTFPVAVTDVRKSRRWTLEVLADTVDEADDIDLLLASGDVILVQVPAGTGVPAGYVVVGDTRRRRTSRLGPRRIFELPCTEVAAPTADIVGATATCQTVLDTYPTCAALLAAHSTCLSVMELIGDPTEVIVP